MDSIANMHVTVHVRDAKQFQVRATPDASRAGGETTAREVNYISISISISISNDVKCLLHAVRYLFFLYLITYFWSKTYNRFISLIILIRFETFYSITAREKRKHF